MTNRGLRPRPGFALLAVLWVVSSAALLGVVLASVSRDKISAASNRIALMRTHWAAEGCVARARLTIDSTLALANGADSAWTHLDAVLGAPLLADCDVRLEPAGLALDVNTATAEELQRLLLADGIASSAADSLVAALLDWIDADDEPRSDGAERDWYTRQQRSPPRNARFADTRELGRVRRFNEIGTSHPSLLSHVTTESDRIYLSRAPLPVLAALPGVGPELLARVAQRRETGAPVADLASIADELPRESREELLTHFSELSGRLTTMPDAWLLTLVARDPRLPVRSTVELRLVHAGARAAIVRRRSDP